MRVYGGVLTAALLLAAALATIPPAPADPGPTDASVQVSNFQFTPATVTIQAGDQVTWDWAGGTHSVETRNGADVWCGVRSSGSCAKSFPTPGSYDYRCGVHPSSMLGTVVVEGEIPQVAIDTPADGSGFEEDFLSSGTASHSSGISAVAWRVDQGSDRPVDSLTTDGSDATWSMTVEVAGLAAGTHTLTVTATAVDGTASTASIAFEMIAPDAVDLRVKGLTTFGGLRSAQIHAQVENGGTVGVLGATLEFQYHYHGTWRTIATRTLDLAAGQTSSRGITWDSDGKVGVFDVRAVLDLEDAIPESDETNNEKQGQVAFGSDLLPGLDPFEPL